MVECSDVFKVAFA